MYKKVLTTITVLSFLACSKLLAQQIPATTLLDIKGKRVNTQQLNDSTNTPIVLAFWATWCLPCINELSNINDNYDDWQKKRPFKLYAVATDDSRTAKKIEPLVLGKGWQFDVLIDNNQNLKRALNIANIPTVLVIKSGKIIYKHNGYVRGDEKALYDIISNN